MPQPDLAHGERLPDLRCRPPIHAPSPCSPNTPGASTRAISKGSAGCSPTESSPTLRAPWSSRGAEAAADLFAATTRRFADGTPRTKHLTTNSIVELSDDRRRADVRSYFVVLQQIDDGPLQPIAAGRYHDRLALVDDRWEFRERMMLPEMFGDVSNHLLFDPSQLVDPREPE